MIFRYKSIYYRYRCPTPNVNKTSVGHFVVSSVFVGKSRRLLIARNERKADVCVYSTRGPIYALLHKKNNLLGEYQ